MVRTNASGGRCARWTRRGLAGLAAAAVLAPVQARADRFDRLAAWIESELAGDESPSLAVAVARDGKIIWAQGFGFADRDRQVPATADTRYSLASVSKPITATGLMVLAERGLVDLDRPINDYLGDTPLTVHVGAPDEATVRRVAYHTAGLPLHHHFFVEGQKSPPPMEETIRRYGHVGSAPGERFQYSNLGYGLLGHLVARRAGQSFGEFMRDEVFRPLGMSRTTIGIPPGERDDFAIRYGRDGRPLPYYAFDHDGASGVFSSARDLARFGLLHVERPTPEARAILSAATLRAMQRPGGDRGNGTAYGIGWQIRERRGVRIVSHSGGMPGVTTLLTLVPATRLVVVALANGSSPLPALVTDRLLGELAPAVTRAARARSPARQHSPAPQRKPARRLVGSWSGQVHAVGRDVPLGLRIDAKGDVFARIDGGRELPLAGVVFERDTVRGLLRDTRLPAGDAAAADVLHLNITRRDDALGGWVTAHAGPDRADGFALSHAVQLRRHAPRRPGS